MSLDTLFMVTQIVSTKTVIQTQKTQLPNLLSELLSSPDSHRTEGEMPNQCYIYCTLC